MNHLVMGQLHLCKFKYLGVIWLRLGDIGRSIGWSMPKRKRKKGLGIMMTFDRLIKPIVGSVFLVQANHIAHKPRPRTLSIQSKYNWSIKKIYNNIRQEWEDQFNNTNLIKLRQY